MLELVTLLKVASVMILKAFRLILLTVLIINFRLGPLTVTWLNNLALAQILKILLEEVESFFMAEVSFFREISEQTDFLLFLKKILPFYVRIWIYYWYSGWIWWLHISRNYRQNHLTETYNQYCKSRWRKRIKFRWIWGSHNYRYFLWKL